MLIMQASDRRIRELEAIVQAKGEQIEAKNTFITQLQRDIQTKIELIDMRNRENQELQVRIACMNPRNSAL